MAKVQGGEEWYDLPHWLLQLPSAPKSLLLHLNARARRRNGGYLSLADAVGPLTS